MKKITNLIPLDYFIWGNVKSEVYENNPLPIPQKDEIFRVIDYIEPELWQNVIEKF